MLERLPESLGNLSSLNYLDVSYCSLLETLPKSFENLSSLQSLFMEVCSKLERLPDSFGNLSSLQSLVIWGCSMLERLPENFGNLSSLQTLYMNDCSMLERLPESFGNLSSLQTLDMNDCSMLERLPESFGNLSALQRLDISNCSMLERLPESFGNLSSLQTVYMNDCSMLERLPESFGNLSALQRLNISNCSMLERLPESFGKFSSMKSLNISNCSMLERLPQTFAQLSCLQSLKMDGLKNMCSFFDNFGQFKCLKFLSISNCKELKKLPDDIVYWSSLAAVKAYGCAELEAKAMDSLVEIKSLMFLEMGESPMLIKRWQQIQQDRPLIGAALRFENYVQYPYEEIMSTMFFSSGSRFLHVDGEGQLAEVASSSFLDVGVKVGLMMTASDLSNELRQKVVEVASQEFQIIYVDVDVEREAAGFSWMEEREKRIKKTLLELPEGSRGWVCPLYKTSLLFAYSLWHFTRHSTPFSSVDSLIVVTRALVDKEGRRKLSQPLEMIFRTKFRDRRVDLTTVFSPLLEAWRLMRFDGIE